MRALALFATLLLVCAACPQEGEHSIFLTRPDVTLTVSENQMTTENVTLAVLVAGYPPDLLRQQLEQLGKELNSGMRILYIKPEESGQPGGPFLKANFS